MIPSVDPAGGGPIEGVRQLRSALAELGVAVSVCSGDPPDAPCVDASELDVIALGPGRLKYGFNPRMLHWLRKYCTDYDAVIVEGIWQFHSLATWLALRGKPVPYFVFTHGMLDPWFKQHYPLKHVKKWLYWLVGDYWVLRHARAVLFTCEEEQLRARESFRIYRCNERIASYGTARPPDDAQRQQEAFLAAYPAAAGKRNLLFLGRLHEKKGCDLLLRAFANVARHDPALQLVMAGPCDPALRRVLFDIAEEAGIDGRVIWTGMLAGNLKWGAFRVAEAFCLPSHQENFGVAVVEAMACGVPVLISDKVNIWREIVQDGAGLAGDDSVDGTTAVLRQWLAMDRAERACMGVAAVASFHQRFQVQQVAARLLHLVSERDDDMPSSEANLSGEPY
ncbi:glycosyltransferase [Cupriavidus necator]|uniref:glycosyltransferase n=1 Tax=Cupriavidus necator TaxID=106590 RepID=UPI003F732A5B